MFKPLHLITRLCLGLLSLSLGLVYLFPLWRIDLIAPQYPEGLGLWIWVNRMSGDIDTINGLNHYIGMQEIHPNTFSELRFMPWVLAAMIVSGLGVAMYKRFIGLLTWFGFMALCGLVGFWDFWRWTYDYGHNLNPYAAIKVPGMSYQPPILGTKQLLNFTAVSWPSVGGWVLIAVGFGAALLCLWEISSPLRYKTKKTGATGIVLLILFLGVACAPKPKPLAFEKDQCNFCRMTLVEQDYGGELVTPKGKTLTFDSVECLVNYHLQNPQIEEHSLWVQDAENKVLIEATQAHYLHSDQVPSPMGANLTALGSATQAESLAKKFNGKTLTWDEVLTHLKKAPQKPHTHRGHH